MSLVVNYATISFRPHWELGEFVNVGILAIEAQSRYLSYKLLPAQRTKRISACFPELDLAIYRAGLKRFESELAALAIETNLWTDDTRQVGRSHPAQGDLFVPPGDTTLFRELTAPTISPFFYGVRGTRLTNDLDSCLEALFHRFVERHDLTTADFEEKKLVREIRRLLHSQRLDRLYREAPWVGTDAYHVGIPLAFQPEGEPVPLRAIKPLNLDQATPTRIYTHGDEWISKLRRLDSVGHRPPNFLFVVRKPADEGEELAAAEEICESLRQLGAAVAGITDRDAILAFARPPLDDHFQLMP
jgi:Protein of unknown function (DUF3037)